MTASDQFRSLADIIRYQSTKRPDKLAFTCDSQRVTYSALNQRTNRSAHGLLDFGITPNERVCYLGKNSLCYFELLLALSKVGAVMVPLNWRLAAAEISFIIQDTGATLIVITEDCRELIDEVSILLSEQEIAVLSVSDYESWLDRFDEEDDFPHLDREQDVLQLYTSGTTGKPKGVRISNRALLISRSREIGDEAPRWNRWTSDDISLISMPCFHIGGTGFGLTTLFAGATGVIMQQFNADKQLDVMVEHGITKMFIVPSALRSVLGDERIHTIDLSALKYISYGASPIPLELMQQCIDSFGCGFVQKYGMTETCGSCVALGPEDHTIPANPKMNSVGKPLSGIELRIVDAEGNDLPIGDTGEIVIRSAANMSGYWNNDQATQAAYVDQDWLRTGDAGCLDEDGYLYIRDRLKDMIVSGGENVYSAEVEAALMENPAIAEVAVFAVPDAKWGEAVHACVVLKPDIQIDAPAILAHCRSLIAGYKTPKSLEFADALPRNASGKVLKHQLRAPHWRGHDRQVS